MVGLLCPDEPLPPDTIQHYTTYLALLANIRIELEFEIGAVEQFESVGDDLLVDDDRTENNDRRIQTPEEKEERIRHRDLIFDRKRRTRKRLIVLKQAQMRGWWKSSRHQLLGRNHTV